MDRPGRRTEAALVFIGAGILNFLFVQTGLLFSAGTGGIAAIWPASGLQLALVMLSGRERLIPVAAAVFASNAAANLLAGAGIPATVGLGASNLTECLLAAWILGRATPGRLRFTNLRDTQNFILLAVLCTTALAAVPGAMTVSLDSGTPLWEAWERRWLGHAFGMMIVAPFAIEWVAEGRRILNPDFRRLGEGIAAFFPVVAVLALYVYPFGGSDRIHQTYTLLPFLIWIVIRLGSLGTVTANAGLGVTMLVFAFRHSGSDAGPGIAIIREAQLFAGITAGSLLVLSAVIAERDHAARVIGEDRWVRDRSKPITGPDGRPERRVGTNIDVTDKVEAEARLLAGEEKFTRAFDLAPVMMSITSIEGGVFLEVNNLLCETSGYSREELLSGQSFVSLGWYTRSTREAILSDLEQKGRISNLEIPLTFRNGKTIQALVSAESIDVDGQRRLLLIAFDITERKRTETALQALRESLEDRVMERTAAAERKTRLLLASDAAQRRLLGELREANAELDSFSRSVAHDLRSPLRQVTGFSRALLEDEGRELSERGRIYLAQIRESTARMESLLEALMDLSRVSRTEIRRHAIDLSEIGREIAEELRERHPERSVEFLVPEGIMADGDPRLIRLVIQNLLDNAWKFTARRSGARVEFGSTVGPDGPEYFIRDNGAGFDPTFAGELFRPFQRLHPEEDFPGTGIGLATVKRIISRHGGWIRAVGTPGEGAEFRFHLPGGTNAGEDADVGERST